MRNDKEEAVKYLDGLVKKYANQQQGRFETLKLVMISIKGGNVLIRENERFGILSFTRENINEAFDELYEKYKNYTDAKHKLGISLETRRESYEAIKEVAVLRGEQVVIALESFPDGATAKELAVYLHNKGIVNTSERNATAPRCTELVEAEKIKIIGKKKCQWTNRSVSVYALV